jgi:hypothetical protein
VSVLSGGRSPISPFSSVPFAACSAALAPRPRPLKPAPNGQRPLLKRSSDYFERKPERSAFAVIPVVHSPHSLCALSSQQPLLLQESRHLRGELGCQSADAAFESIKSTDRSATAVEEERTWCCMCDCLGCVQQSCDGTSEEISHAPIGSFTCFAPSGRGFTWVSIGDRRVATIYPVEARQARVRSLPMEISSHHDIDLLPSLFSINTRYTKSQ